MIRIEIEAIASTNCLADNRVSIRIPENALAERLIPSTAFADAWIRLIELKTRAPL